MSAFKGTPVAEKVSTRNADCPGCGRAVPAYVCKDCNGDAVNQHNETCTGCDGWGENWDYCGRCIAALREGGAL